MPFLARKGLYKTPKELEILKVLNFNIKYNKKTYKGFLHGL